MQHTQTICDVCGVDIDTMKRTPLFANIEEQIRTRRIDLCEECAKPFHGSSGYAGLLIAIKAFVAQNHRPAS